MKTGMYSISPAHYDDIPDDLMQGDKSILDFGCATGINQVISRHRDFFLHNNREGRYLGVDLEPYEEKYLNIVQGDIRTFEPERQYDIVIALHVIEHIPLDCWPDVITRLQSFVSFGGVLIIGTPNKEPAGTDFHEVFNIDADMLLSYIVGAEVYEIKTAFKFAEDGARFSWALLRYIKRMITRHPFVRRSSRLIAIWRNQCG